jgi:hypothetical protein
VEPETVRPEEVPPLELRSLRDLDLDEPAAPDRPAHVSAASGVVRRGAFAYVIGDDDVRIGVFDLSGGSPGTSRRVFEDPPPGDVVRKPDKPDLEALTVLPPFEGAPHGGLLGLGSGSKETRDRGFFWGLEADGSLHGRPRVIDFDPLYGRLRAELGALNIEGAAVFGDRLWLFNRGDGEQLPNAVAELPLAGGLWRSLCEGHEIDIEELGAVREYELGELEGVPLCFSDATAIVDQLVLFTASAESAADGSIHGSVVGAIDSEGRVQRLRTIDPRWKVEGVHGALEAGILDLVFVCDQDDPETPSPLLTATMPLERRFEPSPRSP